MYDSSGQNMNLIHPFVPFFFKARKFTIQVVDSIICINVLVLSWNQKVFTSLFVEDCITAVANNVWYIKAKIGGEIVVVVKRHHHWMVMQTWVFSVKVKEVLPRYKYVMLLSLLWRQSLITRQQEVTCHLLFDLILFWYFPYSWNKWKYQWYIMYLNQTLDICTHEQFRKKKHILYVQICYTSGYNLSNYLSCKVY